MSLRDVAEKSGLSYSFLGALERGETDIALERLARIAQIFGHDVGSFLGYSARKARPQFLPREEQIHVDRGEDIDFRVLRLPGMSFEFVIAELPPRTAFRDELTHEGVDVVVVTSGTVVVRYNHEDYTLRAGEAVMWSGGYPHGFRNDSARRAQFVGVVTADVY
jgi:transcriptional regulator with XRE-family HTH domain